MELERSPNGESRMTADQADCLRAISRIDSFWPKCIRRMVFNSPMWITPLPPPLNALGKGSHGSVLSENYSPNRLSSG